ncbi:MAG: HAD family hydrolase [Firmicutes bacterium]|nr:HAD family hydrolase [Bacillota bacterium]
MSIRIVALDLDGTTLNSKGELSDNNRKTLEEACAAGVEVVYSTGRVFASIPKEVLTVKGIRYVISANGAVINDLRTGEPVYGDFLAENAVLSAIEIAKEHELQLEAFWNGRAFIDKAIYDDILENGMPHRNAEYVLRTRTPIDGIFDGMHENKHRIENLNFFFKDKEQLEEYRPLIQTIPDAMFTSSFINNIEVGGPGTSKRKALEALLGKLELTRDDLMCCGDAANDIEMIRFAGVGVAMGNAWEETKKAADYIAASNDEDGVAEAIRHFCL